MMIKAIERLTGVHILSKQAQKKISGGLAPSGCGVKVGGNWHPSGQGASGTSGLLGQAINGTDNQTWWTTDGGSSYINGNYSGTVTNWCCDSCPWNGQGTT